MAPIFYHVVIYLCQPQGQQSSASSGDNKVEVLNISDCFWPASDLDTSFKHVWHWLLDDRVPLNSAPCIYILLLYVSPLTCV